VSRSRKGKVSIDNLSRPTARRTGSAVDKFTVDPGVTAAISLTLNPD
jgi:hypothetical protein